MAVFETASENSFSQLSTSVADKLNLSLYTPVGRLISGQLRYAWRVTETLTRSRSLLIDALSRAAVLSGKTAAIKQLLKQFYYCRLFLINLRFLKRYRTSARLPGFKIPVEILSSPRRRKLRINRFRAEHEKLFRSVTPPLPKKLTLSGGPDWLYN